MTVICDQCGKTWRQPCSECADTFADYHRNTYHHQVAVIQRNDTDRTPPRRRRQRYFWET